MVKPSEDTHTHATVGSLDLATTWPSMFESEILEIVEVFPTGL